MDAVEGNVFAIRTIGNYNCLQNSELLAFKTTVTLSNSRKTTCFRVPK
jgi:hypothetical protein